MTRKIIVGLVALMVLMTLASSSVMAATRVSYDGRTVVIALSNAEYQLASNPGGAKTLAINTIIPILRSTRWDYRTYYDSNPRELVAVMSFEDRIALDLWVHATAWRYGLDPDGSIGLNNWLITDPTRVD